MSDTENLCCSFCSASQDEVRKLVSGQGVYICDACIAKALSALVSNAPTVTDRLQASQTKNPEIHYCAFCGTQPTETKRMLERKGTCICKECLLLSLGILVDEEVPFNGIVSF